MKSDFCCQDCLIKWIWMNVTFTKVKLEILTADKNDTSDINHSALSFLCLHTAFPATHLLAASHEDDRPTQGFVCCGTWWDWWPESRTAGHKSFLQPSSCLDSICNSACSEDLKRQRGERAQLYQGLEVTLFFWGCWWEGTGGLRGWLNSLDVLSSWGPQRHTGQRHVWYQEKNKGVVLLAWWK